MARLDVGDAGDHGLERLVPGNGYQHAIFPEQRDAGTAGAGKNVVLAQPFRAELAAIDRMVRVAARCYGLAALDADQHAAADRAVAARGLHPRVGNPGDRNLAVDRILGVAVLLLPGVDADQALESLEQAHACTPVGRERTKVRAMFSGTTVTKEIAGKQDRRKPGCQREQRVPPGGAK